MSEWQHVPSVYCPCCAARAIWAGERGEHGRVAYCMRCNTRIILKITPERQLSIQERRELIEARRVANVDGNSAVGAFG